MSDLPPAHFVVMLDDRIVLAVREFRRDASEFAARYLADNVQVDRGLLGCQSMNVTIKASHERKPMPTADLEKMRVPQ